MKLRQRIRFCDAPDGVRIAYSAIGQGTPLVMLSGRHSHLERDADSPVFGHWIAELARHHTLVRLDTRGFGLADRDVGDHSIDAVASDVHAVADALGLQQLRASCLAGRDSLRDHLCLPLSRKSEPALSFLDVLRP